MDFRAHTISLVSQFQNIQFDVDADAKLHEWIEPNTELNLLLVAILEGFDEAAVSLINSPFVDVNYATSYGLTALILALERQDEGLILQLLCRGADPNINNRSLERKVEHATIHCNSATEVDAQWKGQSPLQLAIDLNHFGLVTLLLNHNALVDDISLRTALTNKHDEMACILIEHAGNLTYRDECDRTLLHLANEFGCMKAAELLPICNLHLAVKNEKCSLVTQLLQAGTSVRFPQPGQGEWKTLEAALKPLRTTKKGQLRKKNRRLIKILFSHVFKHESEQGRREILAYLIAHGGESYFMNSTPTRELVIQYLARYDTGIQQEFFERLSDQLALPVENFYSQCVKELTDMKEIVLYEKVTLYKFFARSGASQVKLMKNQALIARFEICGYKTKKYPIYKNMLKELLYEAKRFSACYWNVETTMQNIFMQSPTYYAMPISEILNCMSKNDIFKMHCGFKSEVEKMK